MTEQERLRPGFKQTGIGVIPEEWRCVTVADLVSHRPNSIVGGPFGSDLVSKDYVPIGVPVIRGQNMGGHFVGGEFAFVSPEKAKLLKINTATPRDIVFTQRGTLGQVAIVPNKPFEVYIVSQSQMRITPDQSYDGEYLLHFFVSDAGQKQILESAIQTGVPHTNLGILRSYKVPAPPLPEQRAIAAALSDADALIASLDALIAKKRDLKQAAMQQLLAGKTRLPGFSGEWKSAVWGDVIASCGSGATPSRRRPDFYQGKIRWITSGELNFNVINDTVEHISLEAMKAANLRLHPKGTFLMAITGLEAEGTRGSCGIVGAPSTNNQSCMAIYTGPGILSDYFYHFYVFRGDELALKYCQGTKQQSYTARIVRTLPIEYPENITEQAAIAEILSDFDRECAVLECKRDKAHALKQGMMQELLTGRIRLK